MQFLYPNVLWMLLIPIILLIVLIATNKNSMQIFFNDEVLQKLRVNSKSMRHETRNFVFFAALILMVLALARPVMNQKEFDAKQELIPIVVALDISKSMLATDIYPNRLELAKKKLKHLIKNAQNSAIAVVLFAKSSFVLSPITQDVTSLLYMVENLDSGMNFDNGSNIYSVIEASIDLTKEYQNKNVIILSDGGDEADYNDALQKAKENKINIYSIGLATTEGSPIPIEDGKYLTNDKDQIVIVKLNEALKNLAMQSQGGYINFSLGNNDIDMILSDIYSKSKKDQFEAQKVKHFVELFYYPLALALLLLLVAFSSLPRKLVATTLILIAVVPQQNLHAGILDFQVIDKANQSYENKEYEEAELGYQSIAKNAQGYYNYANSLYKQGKYEQAIKQYEKVVTSDKELEFKKLHNMGNAFAYANKLDKAEEFYKKALQIKQDKETQENLEEVQRLQNKEKQDKNDQGQQGEDQNDQQQNEDKEDQEQDQKNKDQQQQDKQNQNQQNNQQEEKKEQSQQNSEQQKQKEQPMQQQEISDTKQDQISQKEEEKWMGLLEKQKAPVLLHEVKGSKDEDVKNPW